MSRGVIGSSEDNRASTRCTRGYELVVGRGARRRLSPAGRLIVMDSRGEGVRDFVATARDVNETIRRTRLIRLKWLGKYRWLVDEQRRLREDVVKLRDGNCTDTIDVSNVGKGVSCPPLPLTANHEYGWLALRPEFRLEKYGSLIANYYATALAAAPIHGDIPTLAGGMASAASSTGQSATI